MVFKDGGNGNYYRDSVIMENEGAHGYSTWDSIPEAYSRSIIYPGPRSPSKAHDTFNLRLLVYVLLTLFRHQRLHPK